MGNWVETQLHRTIKPLKKESLRYICHESGHVVKDSLQPYNTCPRAYNGVVNGGRETNRVEMGKRWFVSLRPSPMPLNASDVC